jgi:hypothetical protein
VEPYIWFRWRGCYRIPRNNDRLELEDRGVLPVTTCGPTGEDLRFNREASGKSFSLVPQIHSILHPTQ